MLQALCVFYVLVHGHGGKHKASYLHKTFSRKGKAVHMTPTKDYQKFVNVYIFVFVSSGKRGDAVHVLNAQRKWESYTEAEL